jgi:hypothetical protein
LQLLADDVEARDRVLHQTGSGAIIAATRLPSAPRSTSARHAHRHHRLQLEAVGVLAAAAQVPAERAGDRGEHHVVHRAAELVLDRLDVARFTRTQVKRGAGRSTCCTGWTAPG